MRVAYRAGWLVLTGMVGIVGVAVGALFAPPTAVIAVIIVMFVVVVFGSGWPAQPVGRKPRSLVAWTAAQDGRTLWLAWLWMAGCVAVAAVWLVGLSSLIGVFDTVAVAVLLTACSPRVLRRWAGRPAGATTRTPPAEVAGPRPGVDDAVGTHLGVDDVAGPRPRLGLDADPARLTDEQLCWMWRASFTAVHRAHDPRAVRAWADARAAYLDELQRRYPAGFAQWMAQGARAASNPARYLPSASSPRRSDH